MERFVGHAIECFGASLDWGTGGVFALFNFVPGSCLVSCDLGALEHRSVGPHNIMLVDQVPRSRKSTRLLDMYNTARNFSKAGSTYCVHRSYPPRS
jgi:hypothetical protein